MGQIQNKPENQDKDGSIFHNKSLQPDVLRSYIAITKPINKPLQKVEIDDGKENLSDTSGFSSHIEIPRSLYSQRNIQPHQINEENLSYTDTIMNESLRMFNLSKNVQDLDVLDFEDRDYLGHNYPTKSDKQLKSKSFDQIQNILVQLSESVDSNLLKSINPQSLEQLLQSFSNVIDVDFQIHNNQGLNHSEIILQTYVLEQILVYNRFLTQMTKQLEGLMQASLIQNLKKYKIERNDTKTSLVSQVQLEVPAQLIKNTNINKSTNYFKLKFNSVEQDDFYFQQLRDHTNLILKADFVEEIPLDKYVESSSCNKTLDHPRTPESSHLESDRYTPSTASEFLLKSYQLRAEISNLMGKHNKLK